ncbi:MAG: sugar transferase [Patescibacteria group bacterium]
MSTVKKLILLIGDIMALYTSLAITILIRYGQFSFGKQFDVHIAPFSIIFIIWLVVIYISDLHRYQTFQTRAKLFNRFTKAVALAGTLSAISFYLFYGFFELTPKTNLLIFSITSLALLYIVRIIFIGIFTSGAIKIIILGSSPLIAETIKYIKSNKHSGYVVVRWTERPTEKSIDEIALAREADMIVIQPSLMKDFANRKALYQLLPLEVGIMNFPDFYEMLFEKIPLSELREEWFIENVTARRPFYDSIKRALDFIFGLLIAIVLFPFALLISIGIKITSSGPVLYKQERVGKGGIIFTLYKFRSMRNGNKGPLWTTENDSRITALGKFIRFTHLDEIPQLINIIRGDISIAGPRPERVELAKKYEELPYYEMRHIIKPGLTGWAQISFKPSASLEEAYEKLRYDIYYVKNRSLLLDFLIALKTIRYIFTQSK